MVALRRDSKEQRHGILFETDAGDVVKDDEPVAIQASHLLDSGGAYGAASGAAYPSVSLSSSKVTQTLSPVWGST